MVQSRIWRWLLWLAIAVLVFSLLLVGSYFFATRALKTKVEAALGASGQIGEIKVGFSSIEIRDLRIKAAPGWPTTDEFRAKRVTIRPDLAALASSQLRIARIDVEEAYISLLRRRDGKMLILPSLMNQQVSVSKDAAESSNSSGLAVQLGAIAMEGGVVDFFDATVRKNPHQLRLENVSASLGEIKLPALDGRTTIDLRGMVKGVRQNGRFSIKGSAEFSSRDSEIVATLQDVDMLVLQPYLMKAAETGVRRGTLNLALRSTIKNNRLNAPGTMTLSDLELTSGGSFMGLPRSTLVSAMKDKNGKIALHFVLKGNVNDPSFSLNESFSGQVGIALAGVMGISLEGLAKGVGIVGGTTVKGLGDTFGKLFRKK